MIPNPHPPAMKTKTIAPAHSRMRNSINAQPVLPKNNKKNPATGLSLRLVVIAPKNIMAVKDHLIHGLVCLIKKHLHLF